MVKDELRDGVRIAQLLSSEVTGHEDPPFDSLSIANADKDVEPETGGAHAYDITYEDDLLASVFVHEDRAHVEFRTGLDAAKEAAAAAGLRVRPKAVKPPQLLVFVENGAEAKRVIDVITAAIPEK